jgi:hypothetical protein
MTSNTQAVALWIGLIGGAIGIYVPIHSELQQQKNDAIKEAVQRQQIINSINIRFANDESAIAAVATQLPQDKRDILNAVQDAQTKAQAQSQGTMFQKSMTMKPALTKTIVTDAPVEASAPAVKKPE